MLINHLLVTTITWVGTNHLRGNLFSLIVNNIRIRSFWLGICWSYYLNWSWIWFSPVIIWTADSRLPHWMGRWVQRKNFVLSWVDQCLAFDSTPCHPLLKGHGSWLGNLPLPTAQFKGSRYKRVQRCCPGLLVKWPARFDTWHVNKGWQHPARLFRSRALQSRCQGEVRRCRERLRLLRWSWCFNLSQW